MHQSNGGARNIDGHVAAAYHHNPFAQFDLESQVHVDQKVDAVVDARQMRAWNVQFAALVQTRGKQNRIELRAQIGERDIAAQRHTGMQRNSHGQDVIDFHLDDFSGEAKLRNSQIKHSARDRSRLEDLNGIAEQSKVVSAGQAAHSRSYHRNALAALRRLGQLLSRRIVPGAEVMAIGGVALERADGDGLIDLAAPAVIFARVRANPSQHISKWIRRAGQQVSFLVL